jgi:hypothetical protein
LAKRYPAVKSHNNTEIADFRGLLVHVRAGVYAVARTSEALPGSFAVIDDGNEITVVVERSKLREKNVLQVETDWRLLTFDVVLPFDTIGFLAKVSGALADAKVPILVFSGFSTDHLLVREKDLTATLAKLREMGFVIDYC